MCSRITAEVSVYETHRSGNSPAYIVYISSLLVLQVYMDQLGLAFWLLVHLQFMYL